MKYKKQRRNREIDWGKAREYCCNILPKLKSELEDNLPRFKLIEPRLRIEEFLGKFHPSILLSFCSKGTYLAIREQVSIFEREANELKNKLENIDLVVTDIATKNNLKTYQLLYKSSNSESTGFRQYIFQPNYAEFLIEK